MQALDLNKEFPRSPRDLVGGFVIAGRTLDKCRAVIASSQGEYHFDCPLDNYLFDFIRISADQFKDFVSTGADDESVGQWLQENSKKDSRDIVRWNNQMRDTRISDMPIELQEFLENYIPENIPKPKIVYRWFDVYDIEEGRI